MTIHETRLALRAKSLLLVAFATIVVAVAALGSTAEKSSAAFWVCSPTYALVRGADFRCQNDTYRPRLAYIEKLSSPRGYGVYRSSTRGGSSISGTEFWSPTSDYFLQDFGCNPGYPNAHNAYAASIAVYYTYAGTC